MNLLPKRLFFSVGGVLLILIGLNLWLRPDVSLQHSPTSFGVMRDGYKAAFDLLTELHLPVSRSYRRPKSTPIDRTLWFVSPSFLVADKPGAQDAADEVVEWAAQGGTAVVFGELASNWNVLGLSREVEKGQATDESRSLIKGDLGAPPRWLIVPSLLHFKESKDKAAAVQSRQRVRLSVDGKPFALEMAIGKHNGRLVAIADGNFLRNENLADGDASLLLVDLARAFGTPIFDEHSHGLAPPSSLTFAILDSRAILPILIGLLAAILWIFSQRTWPRREIEQDSEMPAPSIASFVESLSILYSRAGDPAAVFRAYRAGFLRRLRRQIGVRTDYPENLLLERISRDRSLPDETRRWLLESVAPVDPRHLVIAVRALESYPRLGHEE